jgi:hypothetical protein
VNRPSDLPPFLGDNDKPQPPPLLTEKQLRPGPGLAIFVGVFAVVAFGAIIWFSSEKGTIIGGAEELPVVKSNDTPIRIKPNEPGGMKIPHQDKLVLKELVEGEQGDKAIMEQLLPRSELPIIIPSSKKPADITKEPKKKIISTDSNEKRNKLLSKREILAKTITSNNKKVKIKKITTGKKIKSGKYKIQLASVRTEKAARTVWKAYKVKHKLLLNQLELVIEKVDIKGKGVFFRVQGGMVEKKFARKACMALLREKQACIISVKK